MSDNKKYYWLKLQKAFFSDKKVKKMRQIAGGEIYTIIYLKLLLESLDNNGLIEFENICDNPAEELSLMIDETEDNIKACLVILEKLKLCEYNDNFISFNDIQDMIGSITTAGIRKSEQRKRIEQKTMEGQQEDNVPTVSQKCPPEIEKEREKDIDLDLNIELEGEKESPPPSDFDNSVYDDTTGLYINKDYDNFLIHFIGVFNNLTARTATQLLQVDGFKTPEKQKELQTLFENRHYDWLDCIKYAESECKKAHITKRWLEFCQIIRVVLRDGADGIKKHISIEEAKRLERQKQLEEQKRLEEERIEAEQQALEIENIRRQKAKELGISYEEYKAQQEAEFAEFAKKYLHRD